MRQKDLDSAPRWRPDTRRAGPERVARRHSVASGPRRSGGRATLQAASAPDQQPTTRGIASDQSATIVIPLVQTGVWDRTAEPQSP